MLGEAKTALGVETFAAAWAEGSALSLDAAIAELMTLASTITQDTTTVRGRSQGLGKLTSREREILQLLVDGRADKENAAALGISERTASKHVAAIRAKLGAPSRSAAAAIAVRDGLLIRDA